MLRTVVRALGTSLVVLALGCGSDPSPSASEDDDGASDEGDQNGTLDGGADKIDAGGGTRDAGTDAGRADGGAVVKPGIDAGQGAPQVPMLRPRCVDKPSQVMIIGDSYINWITHTFPSDLADASGQQGWRLEAIGAASMGSGGATKRVPKQFDDSLEADPDVHTVVMDGGGNDVLVPAPSIDPDSKCKNDPNSPSLPECQRIVEVALQAGSDLMDRAATAGVRDVVYFFYPMVPEETLVGGARPNAINAYALPKVRAMCEEAATRTAGKLRCHFIDMVPVFEGHDDWFFPADIHPNSEGSRAMADAVWSKMRSVCVGQLPSSGCCEP